MPLSCRCGANSSRRGPSTQPVTASQPASYWRQLNEKGNPKPSQLVVPSVRFPRTRTTAVRRPATLARVATSMLPYGSLHAVLGMAGARWKEQGCRAAYPPSGPSFRRRGTDALTASTAKNASWKGVGCGGADDGTLLPLPTFSSPRRLAGGAHSVHSIHGDGYALQHLQCNACQWGPTYLPGWLAAMRIYSKIITTGIIWATLVHV